jgi:tRNA threonylcarbamoyladenosine biosynthesis protein TsaE
MEFSINNIQDLKIVINELKPTIKYNVILFYGIIGIGKTTLIKHLLNNMYNIHKNIITSPTYKIINEYYYLSNKIYHFDLYRINHVNELYEIGCVEYLNSNNLCLIEWPQIIEQLLKNSSIKHHVINIFLNQCDRIITFR